MRLAEGGSVQEHINFMIEICDELSVTGEPIRGENRVVYLLASLPESYNVLVTALEASTEVPTLIVVREHLLHEETKMKSSKLFKKEGSQPVSRRNYDAISVTSQDTLRETAKSLQRSRVRPNQLEKQNGGI